MNDVPTSTSTPQMAEHYVTLVKRHGTAVHAHKALTVLGIAVALCLLYSLAALAWGWLHPRSKRYAYPTLPAWSVVLVLLAPLAYGFASHWSSMQLQFARRSGRLALAAAVFAVFLSAKPAYFPRTYAVPLIAIHKWVGRTAVLLGVVHSVIYSWNYLVRGDSMTHAYFSLYNVFGMIVFVLFLAVFVTSLGPLRRRFYALFYIVHVPAAWITFVLMLWHARPPAAILVTLGLAMLCIQLIVRLFTTRHAVPTRIEEFGPDLYVVVLQRQAIGSYTDSELCPGSYVRVGRSLTHPLSWVESTHPYTLASLPTDNDVKLVVRRTRFEFNSSVPVSIRGPFRAPFDPEAYTKIVCFAGGSGISIVPPIFRTHQHVLVIWAVRHKTEVPVLDVLGIDACDVYLTGSEEAAEEFELDDLEEDRLLTEDSAETLTSKGAKIQHFKGRPLLTSAVGTFLDPEQDGKDACVVACGPQGLVDDGRRWAHRHGFSFYSEAFEL